MTDGSIQPFLKLYDMEKKARDMYRDYASKTMDEELKAVYLDIMAQEENHMKIARKILDIIG